MRSALPAVHEWHERNPWLAFEDGLKLVKTFVQGLEAGTPRAALARLGADLAALEGGTANVTLVESTPAALRRLGLHGERMAHSGSPSRVRLVLGQAPLPLTPERLAASYHGTGWVFGGGAVSMLPYDALFRPAARATPAEQTHVLARGLGRCLAIASPALANNGRAVILLDDDQPATLVAAALGGAAAGCRLVRRPASPRRRRERRNRRVRAADGRPHPRPAYSGQPAAATRRGRSRGSRARSRAGESSAGRRSWTKAHFGRASPPRP